MLAADKNILPAALAPLSPTSHLATNVSEPYFVEPAALRACSACSGDYEDPERAADSPVDDEEQTERSDEGQREKEST